MRSTSHSNYVLKMLDKFELAILGITLGLRKFFNSTPILKRIIKLSFLVFCTDGEKLDFKYDDYFNFIIYKYGVFSRRVLDIINNLVNKGLLVKESKMRNSMDEVMVFVRPSENLNVSYDDVLELVEQKDKELAKRLDKIIKEFGNLTADKLEKLTNLITGINENVKKYFLGMSVKKFIELSKLTQTST